MKKLIAAYLLLAILSGLALCQNIPHTDRKGKIKNASPISNVLYSWNSTTTKQLLSNSFGLDWKDLCQ